jgi:hypothetical protein
MTNQPTPLWRETIDECFWDTFTPDSGSEPYLVRVCDQRYVDKAKSVIENLIQEVIEDIPAIADELDEETIYQEGYLKGVEDTLKSIGTMEYGKVNL